MNSNENFSNEQESNLHSPNEDLIKRIREENEELDKTSGGITSDEEMGANTIGNVSPPVKEGAENLDNGPVTRNQLGDNPPGSEATAFESGSAGDINKDQVKYQDQHIAENFRENIEKTSSEIELDKNLKDNSQESV